MMRIVMIQTLCRSEDLIVPPAHLDVTWSKLTPQHDTLLFTFSKFELAPSSTSTGPQPDAKTIMSSTNSKKRVVSPAEDTADPKRSRATTPAMLNTNIPANEDVESNKHIEVDNKSQANKAEVGGGSEDDEESEDETPPMQNRARAEFYPEVRYSTAALSVDDY